MVRLLIVVIVACSLQFTAPQKSEAGLFRFLGRAASAPFRLAARRTLRLARLNQFRFNQFRLNQFNQFQRVRFVNGFSNAGFSNVGFANHRFVQPVQFFNASPFYQQFSQPFAQPFVQRQFAGRGCGAFLLRR